MRDFADRADGGRRLAAELTTLRGPGTVVLGLPRGGVPVAAIVAAALDAPLDVVVVRKLGVPGREEVAMGAIAEDGVRVLDDRIVRLAGATERDLAEVEARERRTLERRVARLRPDGRTPDLEGATAIVVDDGIATGATATAACRVARGWGAARVVMAAPVAAPDADARVPDADEVIAVLRPPGFAAVGAHYADFRPTTDDEVVGLLASARRPD